MENDNQLDKGSGHKVATERHPMYMVRIRFIEGDETIAQVSEWGGHDAGHVAHICADQKWMRARAKHRMKIERMALARDARIRAIEQAKESKERRNAARLLIIRGVQALEPDTKKPQNLPFKDGGQAASAVALGARIAKDEEVGAVELFKRTWIRFVEIADEEIKNEEGRAQFWTAVRRFKEETAAETEDEGETETQIEGGEAE